MDFQEAWGQGTALAAAAVVVFQVGLTLAEE
jgi:hypothetical protein